jgi:cadmium resistance transport/sequestration family protein
MNIMGVIVAAIAAFIVTNIDDLIVLMMLFAQARSVGARWQILIGQTCGFTILILASLPGIFSQQIVPVSWLSWLGLVPLGIGLKLLFQLATETDKSTTDEVVLPPSLAHSWRDARIYAIAAITVANGGDNIAVYLAFFAPQTWQQLGMTLSIFYVMVGVWCYLADRSTKYPLCSRTLDRYGHKIMPWVFIGLGIYIIIH